MTFLSHILHCKPGLAPHMDVLHDGNAILQLSSPTGIRQGTLEIVTEEVLLSIRNLIKQYEFPLSRMLNDILKLDHIQ